MENGIIEVAQPAPDHLDDIAEHGCVAHKDDVARCDGPNSLRWYSAAGDLWCEAAYLEYGRTDVEVGDVAIGFEGVSDAAAADWIRKNVGLN